MSAATLEDDLAYIRGIAEIERQRGRVNLRLEVIKVRRDLGLPLPPADRRTFSIDMDARREVLAEAGRNLVKMVENSGFHEAMRRIGEKLKAFSQAIETPIYHELKEKTP